MKNAKYWLVLIAITIVISLGAPLAVSVLEFIWKLGMSGVALSFTFVSSVFDALATTRGLLFLILVTLWFRPGRKVRL